VINVFLMSVMVVLLEFVLGIGIKKRPQKRGPGPIAARILRTRQVNPIPPEAGPRIRALALECVMTFTMSYRALCVRPILLSSGLPFARTAIADDDVRSWALRNAPS
jgi:hypothetical protein